MFSQICYPRMNSEMVKSGMVVLRRLMLMWLWAGYCSLLLEPWWVREIES
jgi:hypothetical protein